MHKALLTISLPAIARNWRLAKRLHRYKTTFAVVKSDAYGHGLLETARALSGADGLAVSTLEEALALRSVSSGQPILILHGVVRRDEWREVRRNKFESSLHNEEQWRWLQDNPPSRDHPRIWIKVDSGMGRLGFSPSRAMQIYSRLASCKPVLMSHYACADEPQRTSNAQQQRVMQELAAANGAITSMANSACLLARRYGAGDIARPGIMLFGYAPVARPAELRVTQTLEAPVIAVKKIRSGQQAGYGHRWRASQDGYIAIVRIGYSDGYPRSLPDNAKVYCKGAYYHLAGRVSMDLTTIDLGANADGIKMGDPVELWGHNVMIGEVAKWAHTIPYELFCSVSKRVQRSYVP